jgi:hypothetical protein
MLDNDGVAGIVPGPKSNVAAVNFEPASETGRYPIPQQNRGRPLAPLALLILGDAKHPAPAN